MYRYAYDNCPVCGLTFTDSDDVVVCPECGTPHHRDCYKNFGGCANAEKHADGFSFVSATPKTEDEQKKSEPQFNSPPTNDNETTSQGFPANEADFSSPFGYTITDADEINGVPVGDLKKFIGPNWMYYITLFFAKVKGMRIFRVNFAAFFCSYAWLFARKFYLLGIASSLIILVSNFFMSFYEAYIKHAGIDVTESLTSILTNDDPMMLLGYYAYLFASNIPFIISLLTGIFANKLYMKRCTAKVKSINQSSKTAEQFNNRLTKAGGLNLPLMFISLAIAASYLILEYRGVISNLMTMLIEKIF